MNINHHLDEATLFSYVAGSLSQGMALVVASHISVCESCKARVFETEAIGGALLDSIVNDDIDEEINETALEQALASLDTDPDDGLHEKANKPLSGSSNTTALPDTIVLPGTIALPNTAGEVPVPLRDYIGDSLDELQWKRFSPGFYYFDVFSERRGICRLLKVAPGKSILPHGHHGNELTLLLRGSYADEVGRFSQGDVADLDDQIEHQPLVDGNEDCICLVATDSPLRFTTLLGKVIQPMTRF